MTAFAAHIYAALSQNFRACFLYICYTYLINFNCIVLPCMVGTYFIHYTFNEHVCWFLYSIIINYSAVIT